MAKYIEVNNGGILRVKGVPNGIAVAHCNEKMEVEHETFISDGDFVMLLNLFEYFENQKKYNVLPLDVINALDFLG